MDEQTQAQFVEWLASKLGVATQEELDQEIQALGDEGIQEAFAMFQQEMQTQSFRKGGRLEYLKQLQSYRKGGKAKGKRCETGKDSKTAVGLTKESKKKDKGLTVNKRTGENKKQWLTAVN